MSEKSGKEKFYTLFIQIHLLALIWSAITTSIAGLLAGLISYLIFVHLLAMIAYIADLESFDIHEMNRKLLRTQ